MTFEAILFNSYFELSNSYLSLFGIFGNRELLPNREKCDDMIQLNLRVLEGTIYIILVLLLREENIYSSETKIFPFSLSTLCLAFYRFKYLLESA